jgi:hypothetical protein
VLEDVVAGPMLADVAALVHTRPLHVVVLMPGIDAIRARDAGRSESGYVRWPVESLHAVFAEQTPRIGHWLDTSEQTPEQTVLAILAAVGAAPA